MPMHPDEIKFRLSGDLPGTESQLKMAPEHRAEELFSLRNKAYNPKLSAVLILLFQEAEKLKIIFIRRSDYVGIHSGQMAFPGGRAEKTDVNLQFTALREVEEEIGIKADSVEVLGNLSDLYIPPSNFLVRPFVGYLKGKPDYVVDNREVKEVKEFELDLFFQENIIKKKDFQAHNSMRRISAPYYEVNGTAIWGATAMILAELLDMLR